jgi:hypothetical protein
MLFFWDIAQYTCMDEVARFRACSPLVPDPALDVYKNALPEFLSEIAREVLRDRCRRLLDHMWKLVEDSTGIRRHKVFFAAFRKDLFNVCLVTSDVETVSKASISDPTLSIVVIDPTCDCVATVVVGTSADPHFASPTYAEYFLRNACALAWKRPRWLMNDNVSTTP